MRPTSDRLRETLFNVLAPRIYDARFLDLCAGSGAVGIEALSRGAAHVTFVERSRKTCALIRSNLALCDVLKQEAKVLESPALDFLQRAAVRGSEPWNIAFFDPPYATDNLPVLELLGRYAAALLAEDGSLVVEHHDKNILVKEVGELRRQRILKQGDSVLSFYSHK